MSDHLNPAPTIPASISRTALDALRAKLSAVDGGWLDGGGSDDGDGGDVQGPGRDDRRENVFDYVSLVDDYCALLRRIHDGAEGRSKRRQTPLVNAGYAARMAVATSVLARWLGRMVWDCGDENRARNVSAGGVNVVLIGCGMDALGLWSKRVVRMLHRQTRVCENDDGGSGDEFVCLPSPILKVYEFDAWENCALKRRALLKSGLLRESSSSSEVDCGKNPSTRQSPSERSFCTVSEGTIVLELDGNGSWWDRNEGDYHLVALDLRETSLEDDAMKPKSVLSRAMQNVGLDATQPTIILSELVLAYLGKDGADAVLRSVAKVLRGNERSLFTCLEPMFQSESDRLSDAQVSDSCQTKIISVEGGYSRDYGQHFLGKLRRGTSENRPSKKAASVAEPPWLHPLGTDPDGIRARLKRCGFPPPGVRCTSLGRAAAATASHCRAAGARGFLRAKEPFDEHAALALNLRCYGVVCASYEVERQIGGICPWEPATEGAGAPSFRVRPITSSSEDDQVRDLYGKIYTHLYGEYPAILKMVKSALKMDLRARPAKGGGDSTIRDRFADKEGDFWVADDGVVILGCMGVGLRKKRNVNEEMSAETPSVVVEYEIQRLAVDEKCRGKGLGRKFLRIVEEYARLRQSRIEKDSTSVTIKLWAITPQCLVAANQLYKSVGYEIKETFQAGSLCMNAYCKSLHCSNNRRNFLE